MALSSIQIAEAVIRVSVVTELAILIACFYRARSRGPIFTAALLFCLCVAGYMLAPLLLDHTSAPQLAYPAILLATLVPVAFWYVCGSIFSEGFHVKPYALALAALTAGIGLLGFFNGELAGFNAVDLLSQLSKLLWLAAAFYLVFRDWKSDLVPPRIRLRRVLITIAGAYIALIMVVELFIHGPAPALLELLNVALIFALFTTATLRLLALREDNLLARITEPAEPESELSALAQQVLKAMTEHRAYAMDGISLNRLAQELRCRPLQLREVINTELGHRNFNAFINLYRIQEVAARLSEPDFRGKPLLTLALDAGFRSLAPFNRSFREHYGVTPSEFRASLSKQ